MNYRKIYAIQASNEKRVIKHFGNPTNASGVYIFKRWNEERQKNCYYVGQAKNLLRRIAQHLSEYNHLALSIKKHGLCSEENPDGWQCSWKFCKVEELDDLERITIKLYNVELYNITLGGQGAGKTDINQRAERKGYNQGKIDGSKKAYKEISELIKKYTNGLTAQKGKIAERKTAELLKLLDQD